MNTRISFVFTAVAAMAAAVPTTARAQGAFEGVVTMQMQPGPGLTETMQYSVKGNRVRMDISNGGMKMFQLYDDSTKIFDMVIPMRQMYMERSVGASARADSAAGKAKIEWTGKKETIAGHECEHATVTDAAGRESDVCLAKDLGTFMGMPGGGRGRGGRGRAGAGWQGHIGQTFPLEVVRDGQVELLVTSVEKKSLDDSLFTVPSGYQKMGMPGGGRGGRPGGL
jgi:hypothetical protein